MTEMLIQKFIEGFKKQNIIDLEEFNKKYNPWETEKADKLIEQYAMIINNKQSFKNFSWLNIEEEYKKIDDDTANINYALPNHVRGDVDSSNLFLCLTNPNIATSDNIKKSKASILEHQKYLKEIVDQSLNRNIFKNISSNDPSSDIKFFQNSNIEESKTSIKKHIYDYNKSIFSEEIDRMLNYKLYNNIDEYKYYIKEILSLDMREIKPVAYYLPAYYTKLLHSNNGYNGFKETIKTELDSKNSDEVKKYINEIINKAQKVKICDIEAFPFRSQNPRISTDEKNNIGNKLLNANNKTSLFSVRIIFRRIALFLNGNTSEKPAFIFRRFLSVWRNNLLHVLENDYDLNKEEAEDLIDYLFDDIQLFFGLTDTKKVLNSTSGTISTGNVVGKKNENISEETLKWFRKITNSKILE